MTVADGIANLTDSRRSAELMGIVWASAIGSGTPGGPGRW
jgi:hypothetical protein